MTKKPFLVLLMVAATSLACTFVTNLVPAGKGTAEPSIAPSTQSDGFSAEVSADGSVLLKWEPISGAQKYLIELQIGDEYIPLATLPSDQVSYTDRNVPASVVFTYRLSSLVGTTPGDSRTVMVETPAASGNPLNVKLEFDQAPAALTIDPNNFDPSTIDPNNFDPSQYMAQPLQAQTVLGLEGGEVSVTSLNGIIYTLSVPPNALRYAVPITLKPISAIPNLPLSGGLIAAVFIAPETLVFDIPATLKMTTPVSLPASSGTLIAAFSFQTDGQEFHLYPFAATVGQGRLDRHLASLQGLPQLELDGGIAPVRNGGGYGKGGGTPQDVEKIAQNLPSNLQDRTEQAVALGEMADELAPLIPIDANALVPLPDAAVIKEGEHIRQDASKIVDFSDLEHAMEAYGIFMDARGGKANKLTDKILDLLVDKAQTLLKENKGACLSKGDFLALDLIERLTSPKDTTMQALSERFKKKFGQDSLDALAKNRKACTFKLKMDSNIVTDGSGSILTVLAKTTQEIELFPTYSQGDIKLNGKGKIIEKINFDPDGPCAKITFSQYPELDFNIEELQPYFDDNDKLVDFRLRFSVTGWEKFKGLDPSGQECLTSVGVRGGVDYWSGQFEQAQFIVHDLGRLSHWKMPKNLAAGNSFKAVWQSDSSTLTFGELKMINKTQFELTVTKNTK